MKAIARFCSLAIAGLWAMNIPSLPARCDEGMFPISELSNIGLKKRGIDLSADEIFNPTAKSLVDGICRVNGCTGSLISSDGLVITNHHCAFDAIQKASTPQRDLLANGFIAKNRTEEVPAPGYTVRITESYSDVSDQVLSVTTEQMTAVERTKAIDKRKKELELQAEKDNPGMRAEVAEMFVGKTYVLFFYTNLKDVRLVFAPPISIGAFGGELDNWEWPRHTGDFSFMRAYTAPDGKPAEYSPENIPYRPKRPLQVQAKGIDEGDTVFLLGYPGRTVRNRTESFVKYEGNIRLPLIVELYSWQISEMEKAGAKDRAVAIKHATRSKSLANVEKRSRGQLIGIQRAKIQKQRADRESKLKAFIASDLNKYGKYASVLDQIDEVYAEMSKKGKLEIYLRELRTAPRALAIAFAIYDAAVERAKPDIEREAPYMDRNFALTTQQIKLDVGDWDRSTDARMLQGMLERLESTEGVQEIEPVARVLNSKEPLDKLTKAVMDNTKLGDLEFVTQCLSKSPQELKALGDPALNWIIDLYPIYVKQREKDKDREGKLSQLYGSLIEIQRLAEASEFIPDANATLRLTVGKVEAYSPVDAIVKTPITTLKGLLEKTTGQEPYITPDQVLRAASESRYGGLEHPRLKTVPVAFLYSTDTTGGNSGSPVLNAKGELVGVNFDRAFEATINDFAWNQRYSRSIGVDIRYVLWITGEVFGAKHIVEEMTKNR
ncbi:MAG: S46 family peptidase [Planctomycetota bacterium]